MTLLTALLITGCVQTAGVVTIGNNTFSTSALATPMAGGTFKAQKTAMDSATKHCESMNKKPLITSASKSVINRYGDGTSEIVFKCLDANSKEFENPEYKTAPESVIEIR